MADEISILMAEKDAKIAELSALVEQAYSATHSRDVWISELTHQLEQTQRQVALDMQSISEYSILPVECSKCKGNNNVNVQVHGDAAELEHLKQEMHQMNEYYKQREQQMLERIHFLESMDENGAKLAAENAKRTASALADYCNILTSKLRSYRKSEKRSHGSQASHPPAVHPQSVVVHQQTPPLQPKKASTPLHQVAQVTSNWGEDEWGNSTKKEEEDLFSLLK
jgi:desulfoferrodoxin (superoxide reductase-like protein)